MKIILYLVFSVFILTQSVFSQDFNKAKLDKYFATLDSNNKFMGSVAVSKNGEIIYTNSIGYADIENNIKAGKNSKYRIGSISKTFTAVLVLKAVEENKLDLNQTIDKYFPSIKKSDKITIENLLYHRSGIHNFTNDKEYMTYNTQAKTNEEMIKIIADAGIDFKTGSKSEYSNSNYLLLSYILEKEFDKSYSKLLKEHIIEPLNLENTYFGGEINTSDNECKSYAYYGNWNEGTETHTSIPMGAGGIVSTPVDLVKFSDALFSGKLLKKESLEKMLTLKDKFGMGIFTMPFYGKTGYGHTGGIDGFNSVFSHFDEDNISYALTSNGSNYNNNNISLAVLSAVFKKEYEIPEFTEYELSSKELDKYLGVYSSEQLPMKITITKDKNTLIAQATGQPSFPLEAVSEHKFKFDQAGLSMEFNPEENTMILIQQGEYLFKKE